MMPLHYNGAEVLHKTKGNRMRIALLCATHRGYRCLEALRRVIPEAELVVISFREDRYEPPFLDDLRRLASTMGAHFIEARNVADPALATFWETTPIDLMLCISWRYLIPRCIYVRPRLGTYIFHDSLLPEYRGFAPTVWAIVNGEKRTGATLFAVDDAVDAGDIIDQREVVIGPDNTIAEVMEAVTGIYLAMIKDSIPRILSGAVKPRPQNQSMATFTCKRLPEDNCIAWDDTTARVYNLIRAVTRPYPGAFTTLAGKKHIVWGARRVSVPPKYVGRVPGRVVEVQAGIGSVVLTGDGALLLTELQCEGQEARRADLVLDRITLTLGR